MSTRVLITGARGFVGHALVQTILEHTDWYVVCANRNNIPQRHDRLAHIISPRLTHIVHDIQHPVPDIGPIDYVLHAGGNPSAADCLANPNSAVQDNILGTVNLLNWAKTQPIKRFVVYIHLKVDDHRL